MGNNSHRRSKNEASCALARVLLPCQPRLAAFMAESIKRTRAVLCSA